MARISCLCLLLLLATSLVWAAQPSKKEEKNSGLAFYGNWCGPGHPATFPLGGEPIDEIDAACKAHDFCYADRPEPECDRVFIDTLSKLTEGKDSKLNPKQKEMAQTMSSFIQLKMLFSGLGAASNGNGNDNALGGLFGAMNRDEI
eukprot:TRINITY_DN2371_c0_g3_i1.p1 TRINITY_DN2371_c0_g3~~TRINITY_DN2371_c0_g3_i1.p1  ORF type:complete len:146 (-),score=70.85 TRINITY_DN2371_c0_g3_i1:212-649(-)